MTRVLTLVCLLNVFAFVPIASAHYFWVTLDPNAGEFGTANLYFEEQPRPGDGHYLDPFISGGTSWIYIPGDSQNTNLKVDEFKQSGKRYLSAKLSQPGPRSIESYARWGVYRYGETDVLLHYNAKYLDAQSADQLEKIARSKELSLDIVPKRSGDSLQLQVFWKGKPAAGRPFYVRGSGGVRKNLKTDEKGTVSFKPKKAGMYWLRTFVDEPDKSGELDGKRYDITRHHSTLTLQLPIRATD